jgi:tetratricopeptide (TPR) repeat protein
MDRHLEATVLSAFSSVHSAKSEFGAATAKLEEARTLLVDIGDKRGAASTLLALADSHLANQDASTALDCAMEAKDICKEIDFRRGHADAYQKLALAHAAKEEFDDAIKMAKLAQKHCKSIEDFRGETAMLQFLASTTLAKGDKSGQKLSELQARKQEESQPGIEANRNFRNAAHAAVKRARSAVDIAKKSGDLYAHATALTFVGHGLAILTRTKESLNTCREAEQMFRECGATSDQACAVCLQAEIMNASGDKAKALDTANRALELARRAEDGQAEARALHAIEQIKGITRQQQQEIPDAMYAQQMQQGGAPGAASAAGPVVPKGLDPDMVQSKLQHVVEQVVGGGEEVHLDTPLMESGMDSLSAVAFRNELSRAFEGVGSLPAALMFDYPSIRSITDHLVDRSKGLA